LVEHVDPAIFEDAAFELVDVANDGRLIHLGEQRD